MLARPLSEFLEDEPFRAKGWKETVCNIVDLYRQPFSVDVVDAVFIFPEVIVGDNWELFKTISSNGQEPKYTILDSKDQEDAVLLPSPQTLSDFIDDCHRVWKKDLWFDGNLIKRNFKIEL